MTDDTPTDDGGEQVRRTISESADKITLKTKVKRGTGTRDEDKVTVKVKGDDPGNTAAKLAYTLDALGEFDVTDTLRETRAGESDE
jgi:hypothetical protein